MHFVARRSGIALVCGIPLLVLAVLVGTGAVDFLTAPAPVLHDVPAAELGIGELEMGRDWGRPAATPESGPLATAILLGVLLLCPAKFVLLWVLQRRESRHMSDPAAAPSGDA